MIHLHLGRILTNVGAGLTREEPECLSLNRQHASGRNSALLVNKFMIALTDAAIPETINKITVYMWLKADPSLHLVLARCIVPSPSFLVATNGTS